ncbi:MAG TPA: NUDIX domain-containing protein [Acidimicrobiia bacterium]
MREALRQDLIRVLRKCDSVFGSVAAEWIEVAADLQSLHRSGHPEHFTASALPVSAAGAEVCLVYHRKMGRWVQPGGHFEPGDVTVAGAAAREMEEETGISGTPGPAPVGLSRHPAPCRPGAWHLDVQMVVIADEVEPVKSEESEAVAWFPVGRLPEPLASGVETLVARAVARVSRTGFPGSAPPVV